MFPYHKIGYATNARSKCTSCKENISNGQLRIGVKIKTRGIYKSLWRHEKCFFKNGKRLGKLVNFDDFNKLKHDDQLRIKGNLVDYETVIAKGSGNLLKEEEQAFLSEYTIEQSNNYRAKCRFCYITIVKEALRISKIEYHVKYGEIKHFYHVECFSNVRNKFNLFCGGEYLPGFENLSKENQEFVKGCIRTQKIPPHEEPGPSTAVNYTLTPKQVFGNYKIENNIKIEYENNKENIDTDVPFDLEDENVKVQNELFHKYKTCLRTLSKKDLAIICKKNNLYMLKGTEEPLDLLADCMVFGALKRCPECGGQLQLRTFFYECTGFFSVHSLCKYRTKAPQRFHMAIPDELKHYVALMDYQSTLGRRIFTEEPSEEAKCFSPKRIKLEHPKPPAPLKNVQFYIYGFNKETKEEIKIRVLKLGGYVANKLVETVAAVITTKHKILKKTIYIQDMLHGYHIVEESFLDEIESKKDYLSVTDSINLIKDHNISDFSPDIYSRVPREVVEGKPVKISGGVYKLRSKQSGISTVKFKDGVHLVSGTGLESCAHVYKENGQAYTATLNRADVGDNRGSNRSYILQLLVADIQKRYCVARSWGQTGSEQTHTKTEFEDLGEAKSFFKKVFFNKTGNKWAARHTFQKKYGKFDLLKMADLIDTGTVSQLSLDTQSELSIPVQNLMILLFDINIINKTIADMEIDTNKMPLGVLSDEQIVAGFELLYKLIKVLAEGNAVNDNIIKDLSNRFYTKIPHKATKRLAVLDNTDIIISKLNMLNDLKNTHISHRILHEEMENHVSRMERYYMQLKTEIVVVEVNTPEYVMIKKYFTNTQSSVHSYKLKLGQLFKVEREGEADRFQPYDSLHNKKLLWHGSRLSNIAAILLQGLRIAPEGVETTGAMFGEGIYFADVVSKSAQYIYSTPDHPHGVLLLCTVALGNMKRCISRDYITELPDGINSVYGVGSRQPDPEAAEMLPDGTEVPLGTIVPNIEDDPEELSLIHNEYIVYNEAQVRIEYLVQFEMTMTQ